VLITETDAQPGFYFGGRDVERWMWEGMSHFPSAENVNFPVEMLHFHTLCDNVSARKPRFAYRCKYWGCV